MPHSRATVVCTGWKLITILQNGFKKTVIILQNGWKIIITSKWLINCYNTSNLSNRFDWLNAASGLGVPDWCLSTWVNSQLATCYWLPTSLLTHLVAVAVVILVVEVAVVVERHVPGPWQTQKNWEPSGMFLWMKLFPTVCCHLATPVSAHSAHQQLHIITKPFPLISQQS